MDKFDFNVKEYFDFRFDYKDAIETAERIKEKCREYEFLLGISCDLSQGMDGILWLEDGRRLEDRQHLAYRTARNLVQTNIELTGAPGWEAVADLVSDETRHDCRLRKYILKPEYAQIVIDKLNAYTAELNRRYADYTAKKQREEAERKAKDELIMSRIKSVSTTEKTIRDEGGKTKEYEHTFRFPDGESLRFLERNIFDFGVTINPCYSVVDGCEAGGLWIMRDGRRVWDVPRSNETRELTDNENAAIDYLHRFGKYARSGVRM